MNYFDDRQKDQTTFVINGSLIGRKRGAGIVKSFLEPVNWGMVQLDAVFTVLDAEQSLDLPYQEARLARAQVVGGDLIMLNKVDLVDDWFNSIRPGVQVYETTQAGCLWKFCWARARNSRKGKGPLN